MSNNNQDLMQGSQDIRYYHVKKISEVPIHKNTLYVIDIDSTLITEENIPKLIDADTNKWFAKLMKSENNFYYFCTYRFKKYTKETYDTLHELGLVSAIDNSIEFVGHRGDKGKSIFNNIASTEDVERVILIDDNPQAHEQLNEWENRIRETYPSVDKIEYYLINYRAPVIRGRKKKSTIQE